MTDSFSYKGRTVSLPSSRFNVLAPKVIEILDPILESAINDKWKPSTLTYSDFGTVIGYILCTVDLNKVNDLLRDAEAIRKDD